MGLLDVTQNPSLFQGGSITPGNYSSSVKLPSPPTQGPLLPNGQFYSGGQSLNTGNNQGQVLSVNNAPAVTAGGVNTGPSLQAIEDAFTANAQALNSQENQTRGQYDLTGQQLQSNYNTSNQRLGDLNTEQTANLEAGKNTVNQQTTNALTDARRAYNELQQRNLANLSASGLSSSSAAEALQENLSKNTLQAINQLTQNRDQTLQNIDLQKTSVDKYYKQQQAELTTQFNQTKDQLGLQLQAAIDKINNDRYTNTANKSQQRAQVIASAQSANQALQQQAAQQQAQLDAWYNFRNDLLAKSGAYAGGQLNLNAFSNYLNQVQAQYAKMGIQLNTGAFLQGLTNPYVGAQSIAQGSIYGPT